MLQSKKEVETNIASLNQTLQDTQNNSALPSSSVLEKKDIIDVDGVSTLIQQAADANNHDIILLNLTQTDLSTTTTLTNIQTDQLDGKNIEAVTYTVKAQGDYQQLLGFLITLNNEHSLFIQSANYAIGDYPDATLTLTIKTYRLSSWNIIMCYC